MRRYLFTLILVIAILWVVPHAMGKWYNTSINTNVKNVTSRSNLNYSFLQCSSEENKIFLIKLTIENYNPFMKLETQQKVISEIIAASKENCLDPFLVTAVIAAESSFRPNAKSPCGARGLMQLTRIVLPSLGVKDPFNIEQNIQGGCKFLGELYQRFGNTTLMLAAYNAGPTRVARLKRVPRIRETQNYVKKVQQIATVLFNHFLASLEEKSINPIAYTSGLHFKQNNDRSIFTTYNRINENPILHSNPLTDKSLIQLTSFIKPIISLEIMNAKNNFISKEIA